MKLVPVFRLTKHFGIGLVKDKKEDKPENKSGCGCLSIFLVLCLISLPFSLVRSCINGEETTTEPTTVAAEESTEYAE